MGKTTEFVVPPEFGSTICPNCAYSLAEIPVSDHCPECGRKRNVAEIVLYGTNLSEEIRSPRTLDGPNKLLLYLVGLIVYSFIFSTTAWYYTVFTVASIAWWRLLRLDNRHPGDVQIRINAQGITQFLHAGGATTLGKLQAGYIWIPSALATVAVMVYWHMNRSKAIACIYGLLAVAMVLLTLHAMRQGYHFHRKRKNLSDTAVIDLNMIVMAPSPWRIIREYWIKPLGSNSYSLRIDDRKHSPGSFVSAIVDLTPSAAAALNDLLKEQILAACEIPECKEDRPPPRGAWQTLLSDLGLR